MAEARPIVDELQEWSDRLRARADAVENAVVEPADQLAVENLIAAGVAVLAGEERPRPAQLVPTRPILARDLLITADLVARALRAHSTP